MNGPLGASLAGLCLAATLLAAIVRPRGLPEAVVAVPAAALVAATGVVGLHAAWREVSHLLPVVGFLAAVLALAYFAELEGLFSYVGGLLARWHGPSGRHFLAWVFVVAATCTAVLSLDATVVLLTPVVYIAARHADRAPKPYLYACTHLANSASLLMPVSNLTNLLAFAVLRVSFLHFTGLMLVPWLAVVCSEYLVLAVFFRSELEEGLSGADFAAAEALVGPDRLPLFAIGVIGATLVGFVGASFAGVNEAWIAGAGATVLGAKALLDRKATVAQLARATNPAFLVFVVSLGVVVAAMQHQGLGNLSRHLLRQGSGFLAMLATAALAGLLSNIVNNLPALLILLPAAAERGPASLLAVLVGVNLGPNLTYVGSLATLLWRRVLHSQGLEFAAGEFLLLGIWTVPLTITVATAGLWLALRVLGA